MSTVIEAKAAIEKLQGSVSGNLVFGLFFII
jgi:hypothetical protein